MLLKCCFLLLFIIGANCKKYVKGSQGIEAPYLVQIYKGVFRPKCAGAILSEEWIITSGYCAIDPADMYRIIPGINFKYNHNSQQEYYEVEFAVMHHKHNKKLDPGDNNKYNIGLLKLKKPLVFNDKIQPIKIRSTPIENEQLKVSGVEEKNPSKSYQDVISTTVPVLETRKCERIYHANLSDDVFCAGTKKEYLCFEETGDPAVDSYGKLVGIGIWEYQHGCAHHKIPSSLFINVTYHLNWIRDIMSRSTESLRHYTFMH